MIPYEIWIWIISIRSKTRKSTSIPVRKISHVLSSQRDSHSTVIRYPSICQKWVSYQMTWSPSWTIRCIQTMWYSIIIISVTLSNMTFAAPSFSLLSFVKTNSTTQRGAFISWKTLNWKIRNEIWKIEVGKFGPKLEISRRSWKVLSNCPFQLHVSRIYWQAYHLVS